VLPGTSLGIEVAPSSFSSSFFPTEEKGEDEEKGRSSGKSQQTIDPDIKKAPRLSMERFSDLSAGRFSAGWGHPETDD
jgi:hypothetical protein